MKSASSRILQKEFSEYLSTFYRKHVFWSSSYYVASTGGTPIEKIKQYIQSQDALLRSKVGTFVLALKAFARAYSIAAVRAKEWEDFTTFHALADGVLAELKLHKSYATNWGVDLSTTQPGNATRRYTDFLLATAWSTDIGVIAAAGNTSLYPTYRYAMFCELDFFEAVWAK